LKGRENRGSSCEFQGENLINRLYADYIERRDKVQIYADILKVTKRPQRTTRIIRLANIQYHIFLECVDNLCNAGLLEKVSLDYKDKDGHVKTKYEYKATEVGEKWCEMLDEVVRALEHVK
jgi:predicted transcriptional regulator